MLDRIIKLTAIFVASGLAAAACAGEGATRETPVPAVNDGGDVGANVPPPTADASTSATDSCAIDPLRRVYWGDLHVHTAYSLDSYAAANRNDPVSAYAFAQKKGESPIAGNTANKAAIDRKLDFTVVTDHSEFLDVMEECTIDTTHSNYDGSYCKSYRDSDAVSVVSAARLAQLRRVDPSEPSLCNGTKAEECVAARKTAWQRLQAAAKTATQSDCSFTALIGYEWTAGTNGDSTHRNVIFGTDTVPDVPLDYIHYPKVDALWAGLDQLCTGDCKVLTIPHNSNLSNGVMWNDADDANNHEKMRQYQRLVEVYQHKGNSECFPGTAGVTDPDCAFEPGGETPSEAARPGFIREGLARGLELAHGKSADANPLLLGFVGGTDTHNGVPGNVAEGSEKGPHWPGHAGSVDDTPEKRIDHPGYSPGGITAVWARNNTRAELFAALERRETYATSGPRISLRLHAKAGAMSQAQADAYCADPNYPAKLEADGAVPMGSELPTSGAETWLFVLAAKDTTDLDALDLIELHTDAAGKAILSRQEVPLTGGDTAQACRAIKVDPLASGSHGLVYVRAFEKETWRWSHYDCQDPTVSSTAACNPSTPAAQGGVNVKIRERAWSSPIFLQ